MQKLVAGVALGLTATILIMLLSGVDASDGRSRSRVPILHDVPPEPIDSGLGPAEVPSAASLAIATTAPEPAAPPVPSILAANIPAPPAEQDLRGILEIWQRHGGVLDATSWGAGEEESSGLFLASLERLAATSAPESASDATESRLKQAPASPSLLPSAPDVLASAAERPVVVELRRTSRHLEEQAGQLEDTAHYASADRLREAASLLRREARRLQHLAD